MPQVGVRELKNEASEIIRTVREDRAEYIVTLRGRPVAVIVPVKEDLREFDDQRIIDASRPDADYWARLDALAAEIDAAWQSEKSAVELIEEQRR